MKSVSKWIALPLAAGAIAVAGAAMAQSGDILKDKGCLGCHDMDKKKVGPAFKDVAAKYKGKKDAESQLVAKIKDAKGHPKVNASEADIKEAVNKVLAAK